jgi:hypothetical protein
LSDGTDITGNKHGALFARLFGLKRPTSKDFKMIRLLFMTEYGLSGLDIDLRDWACIEAWIFKL